MLLHFCDSFIVVGKTLWQTALHCWKSHKLYCSTDCKYGWELHESCRRCFFVLPHIIFIRIVVTTTNKAWCYSISFINSGQLLLNSTFTLTMWWMMKSFVITCTLYHKPIIRVFKILYSLWKVHIFVTVFLGYTVGLVTFILLWIHKIYVYLCKTQNPSTPVKILFKGFPKFKSWKHGFRSRWERWGQLLKWCHESYFS